LKKSVEIMNLIDEAGYTLLHSAAYYNSFKIADYIINFFKRRLATYLKARYVRKHNLDPSSDLPPRELEDIKNKVKHLLKEWVNRPSRGEEGFYPLHFASFHGNVKLIKLLVKSGANISAKNKQGISMVHVGA
jgi:ankyrin repeat protein